jgi:dienelactone hydrolase
MKNSHQNTILIALATALVIFVASPASAAVQTKEIEYKDGEATLKGHLAWDDAVSGKRPAVLVVHEWWGLNDYARERADKLAKLGYVAFAVDMYGDGKVTEHPKEAGEWAATIRMNKKAWRERGLAGFKVLLEQEQTDPEQVAAIGYCFGGSTVLQLAFSGADLKAVVTFHGALTTPSDEDAARNKAKILVCHGAADSFIPETQIQPFRAALEKAKADWQMVYYAGAKHSFTNPSADKKGLGGMAYNKNADERSWRHMQDLFTEVFAK